MGAGDVERNRSIVVRIFVPASIKTQTTGKPKPEIGLAEGNATTVLTFESFNEITWCDYSIKTSRAVFLNGTICFSIFYKTKFDSFS